jgi:3-oxoacyl-[acyl-carrier protein] reductase
LFDIHVMATFKCTQVALQYIPVDGTGRIINVTSAAGITGTLGQVKYSAAKARIIGITKPCARWAFAAKREPSFTGRRAVPRSEQKDA